MSGFGFQIPQGDPGALDAAAGSWRALGLALGQEGEAIGAAAQVALGAGGWQGPASGAFAGSAERLITAFGDNGQACGLAASALTALARALEQAQQTARQALAECERAQTEASTQQGAADQAGQGAQAAQQAAAGAVHPTVVAALQREATAAEQQQRTAQGAADRARGDLASAQTRGQTAVATYEHEAAAVVGRLHAAAAELRPAQDVGEGWADPIITWMGHANDFAGAGATGLIKGYDSAIGLAMKRLEPEIDAYRGDGAVVAGVLWGDPNAGAYDGPAEPSFDLAANSYRLAENPVTKFLHSSPFSEDSVLGKVPGLAYGLTAADMIMNWHKGVGEAVVTPVGNLAVGTAITETTAPLIASGVTTAAASLAAGDGAIAALAGTALVPGVGEVVAVGVVAVAGTWAVDKGVSWVWDHGGSHVAGEAWDGIKDAGSWVSHESAPAVKTAKHVIHDLEPWHW